MPTMLKHLIARLLLLTILCSSVFAVGKDFSENPPKVMEWTVNGVVRKALVYIPLADQKKPIPMIFAFHGHGGNMENLFRTRGFDKRWPEAIFICPQGINTAGKLTDPDGKTTGWDMSDDASNKDLAFFDAMYKTMVTEYNIDKKAVFVTGHSNGGGFTYLLWANRGDLFRAVAPTATTAIKLASRLRPKPVFHLTGETDPLVKPSWQKLTHQVLLKLNKCDTVAKKIGPFIRFYPSATRNPVELYIHPGGHTYPVEANDAIIDFFKKIYHDN